MDFLRNGVIFNIKAIKEQSPTVWNKYKDYFNDIELENEEEVYLNYLSDKMDGKVLFNFLTECLPSEMRAKLKE
ncbi:hypothetical protein [Metabacillus endolithicus]|uniref:Uncharacterized protein n=1 Tax=Metabacillus endolithicus TaxID=1535204 RepID=A0ABW5C252_9BACI|nr:hypothetical protein [Metabacillus endolithicus]UPG65538.1 hypothetical protein MVE64_11515 [Metabacillus endolithicus]